MAATVSDALDNAEHAIETAVARNEGYTAGFAPGFADVLVALGYLHSAIRQLEDRVALLERARDER